MEKEKTVLEKKVVSPKKKMYFLQKCAREKNLVIHNHPGSEEANRDLTRSVLESRIR